MSAIKIIYICYWPYPLYSFKIGFWYHTDDTLFVFVSLWSICIILYYQSVQFWSQHFISKSSEKLYFFVYLRYIFNLIYKHWLMMIYLNVFQIHCFLGIFRARMFLFQNKTSLVLSYLRNDTIYWIVITKQIKRFWWVIQFLEK